VWFVVAMLAVTYLVWSSGMELAPNFKLAEFTRSATADRLGIDNTPNARQVQALQALSSDVLQPIRDAVGVPVRITSGYRSPELNAAVNGSTSSQHMKGEAADFTVEGYTAKELADLVQELGLEFDQLITYVPSRGGHVHVSYKASGSNRGQRLHAPKGGSYVVA
jgi:zinc D-Ala-D-Ala carboxypeptidase